MPAIVTAPNVEGLYVDVTLTGLAASTLYDVYRLQVRFNGLDDVGAPIYEEEVPGRRGLWSAVAHRVAWDPGATEARFRDYEALLRPFRYFIVPSTAINPAEWDWSTGDYDLANGTLSADVIHFNRLMTEQENGFLLLRSTTELGLYSAGCVYDLDEIRYTARGQELSVIGRQYPVPIMDTREARRGSLTLLTRDLGSYYNLRRIVFPPDGRIKPVTVHSGADPTMLLDDMTVIPLDVAVEQATQRNPDYRWIRLDFVEVDPMDPFVQRTGDNDDSAAVLPQANFTVTPTVRKINQDITLTDTSTGASLATWEWAFTPKGSISTGIRLDRGPVKIRYTTPGTKTAKLRVGDATGAYSVAEKSFEVVK